MVKIIPLASSNSDLAKVLLVHKDDK
jgi:hypothetical protein